MRKKTLFIAFAACICLATGFSLKSSVAFNEQQENAEPVGEEEEGPEKEARIRAYNELIHRAAPGTDWRAIELQNSLDAEVYRTGTIARKGAGAFAGGLLNGSWYERGNTSTAGRMSSFAYEAGSNTLYSLSDAGSLWKINPPSGSWTLLNDKYKLRSKTLAITPLQGSGTRILMGRDSQLVYSDNGGVTLQAATGISYPVAWGGNYVDKIFSVNDAVRSVYALVQGWGGTGVNVWLYRSVDSGKSFSKIFSFSNNSVNQVSLFSPYNSGNLYALAANSNTSDSLFAINGNSVSLLNATNAFAGNVSESVLTGLVNGSQLQLYALIGESQIFQSSDSGATWTSASILPKVAWHVLSSSTKVAGNIFYGNMEAFSSSTGGATFNKVNLWTDYYPTPATKLHADIQAISFFHDASGNEFCVIGTDGGAYYSNNYLATVSNMSLTGLNVNQLWHHISHPDNPAILYSGMQDQGLCYTVSASGTGLITQKQEISGDYGQLRITAGDILWTEYPGGYIRLYSNLTGAPQYRSFYSMQGTQKSNAGWLLPTCAVPGPDDDILLGGGNISGGGGSYISRLSFTGSTVNATQLPFNFRAASKNGSSGVSVMAISELNRKLWYAATEDGTFFWSDNAGTNWNKTAAFNGVSGFYLYGAAIAPSKKDRGTVYFGGSGYSNPGIYVSRDSGLSFTAMNNGLPPTLINSLAVSPGDSLIFAATDAGPYVFITAQQQWYPLIDAVTPGCIWKTVEYIPSIGTARFSTYGRGVWDFVLSNGAPNAVSNVSPVSDEALVYPNPADPGGVVFIKGRAKQEAEFILSDMNGKKLYAGDWNGSGSIRIPMSASGMYTYTIRQNDRVYQGKLLIR
jgi:hypothetical protein